MHSWLSQPRILSMSLDNELLNQRGGMDSNPPLFTDIYNKEAHHED